MVKIKTYNDIIQLREKKTLCKSMIDFFESYFLSLKEELGDDESLEEFSLAPYGYIVLLQSKEDDVRCLEDVGLDPEQGGLLGTWPEFVDIETLEDGTKLYRIGILYDNEYMMVFFTIVGQFDEEVEAFLEEQSNC